jgi:hypothetical protein
LVRDTRNAADAGAQTGRQGFAVAGEETAYRRSLTDRLVWSHAAVVLDIVEDRDFV